MRLFLLAAIPTLLGSLFLMHTAQAGRMLELQQTLVVVVAAALAWALSRRSAPLSDTWIRGSLGSAALVLLLPLLLSSGDGPRRWVSLGGVRLYVASVVLPSVVLLLARALGSSTGKVTGPLVMATVMALTLAAQPDAAQTTAFALACAVLVVRAELTLVSKALTLAGLAGALALAWRVPDPLKPVSYVEGVLALAGAMSPLVLGLALLALALLPALLLWRARSLGSFGLVAVASYYLVIDFLAYRQLTPMPLLGFGAGPILGYFWMASLANEVSRK